MSELELAKTLAKRLTFLAETLNTRWVTQRAADDSARPALIVEVPAREVDATITSLRETAALLTRTGDVSALVVDS